MRKRRLALGWVACVVVMSVTMATQVRGGDPAQFYNEHATETPVSIPVITDPANIKKSIVADLKAGHFEAALKGIARLDIPVTAAVVADAKAWAATFQEKQYRPWATQRRREFEQQVKQAQSLVDRRQESFAAYHLALAYAIAPAQDALRTQDWFVKLTRAMVNAAEPNEKARKWLACWRIYTNLVRIDPQDVTSKQRLARVERRIHLLRLYAPDQFHRLQDDDDRDRVAAGESPAPDARPATAATIPAAGAKPGQEAWRAEVAGATRAMLNDAASDAGVNYIRALTLRDELIAALQGIEDLTATPGLEKTFPSLSDAAKKKTFETQVRGIIQTTQRLEAKQVRGRDFTAAINSLLAANAQSVKLPEDVLFHELADAMCDSLEGKTSMIWPEQVAQFTRSAATPVAGLGLRLRVGGDGEVVVASCIEGAPGAVAGIRAGDVIETIDGIRMYGSSADDAAELIAGKPATVVTLVIRRSADGRRQRLPITRRQVKGASEVAGWRRAASGAWDYFIDPREQIAYLNLNSLQTKSAAELDTILIELKQEEARGIVLDLRDNSGGLLSAAHDVSKRFVRAGIIVRTRAERQTPEPPQEKYVVESEERQWTEMPLVVLVNAATYGGAEMIAAAVQDNARGIVVGERTAGRGDIQMLFPLADRSAYLKLTTHAMYRRNGKAFSAEPGSPREWGVEPNVPVIMTSDQARAAADARESLSLTAGSGMRAVATATDKVLTADFQLSMALLVMRLKLNGVAF